MSTYDHADGKWFVQGTVFEEGTPLFLMLEEVDAATEDPSKRLDYWRSEVDRDGVALYQRVRLVEVQVRLVRPSGWAERCGDHRPIILDCEDSARWECRCGTATGEMRFERPGGRLSPDQARAFALRAHDRHVAHVAENLRCARCGERNHVVDYCDREA